MRLRGKRSVRRVCESVRELLLAGQQGPLLHADFMQPLERVEPAFGLSTAIASLVRRSRRRGGGVELAGRVRQVHRRKVDKWAKVIKFAGIEPE